MLDKVFLKALSKSFYLGAGIDAKSWPVSNMPEVAFIGRSNVGKSSLISTLLNNKKLVRVSKTPGKTRLVHFYIVPNITCLVDLPGYGYSKASKQENLLIEKMLRAYFDSHRVKKIFVLLDIRRIPSEQDLAIMNGFNSLGLPWSIIITKTDKLSKHQRKPHIINIASACPMKENSSVIACSALKKDGIKNGIDELWEYIQNVSHTS